MESSVCKQTFYGVAYDVDVMMIRQRMVEIDAGRATAGGRPERSKGIDGWAAEMGVAHMTLRRLLRGRGEQISLDSLRLILAKLGLEFGDVCRTSARKEPLAVAS